MSKRKSCDLAALPLSPRHASSFEFWWKERAEEEANATLNRHPPPIGYATLKSRMPRDIASALPTWSHGRFFYIWGVMYSGATKCYVCAVTHLVFFKHAGSFYRVQNDPCRQELPSARTRGCRCGFPQPPLLQFRWGLSDRSSTAVVLTDGLVKVIFTPLMRSPTRDPQLAIRALRICTATRATSERLAL